MPKSFSPLRLCTLRVPKNFFPLLYVFLILNDYNDHKTCKYKYSSLFCPCSLHLWDSKWSICNYLNLQFSMVTIKIHSSGFLVVIKCHALYFKLPGWCGDFVSVEGWQKCSHKDAWDCDVCWYRLTSWWIALGKCRAGRWLEELAWVSNVCQQTFSSTELWGLGCKV